MIDTRLAVLARQCKEGKVWPRLYRVQTRDGWTVRQFDPRKRGTTNLALDHLAAHLPSYPRRFQQVLSEVHELLVRRANYRRLLRIIAEIGEAAIRFPGGRWLLRGHQAGSTRVDWYAVTGTGGRALYRPLAAKLVAPEPEEDDEDDASLFDAPGIFPD